MSEDDREFWNLLLGSSRPIIGQIINAPKDCTITGPGWKEMKQNLQNEQVAIKNETKTINPNKNQRVIDAITQIMDEVKDNGDFLVRYKRHWQCIYRILVDYEGYNDSYTSFCEEMQELGVAGLRIPCEEEHIKRINGLFAKPYSEWSLAKYDGNSKVFKEYNDIATRFYGYLKQNTP